MKKSLVPALALLLIVLACSTPPADQNRSGKTVNVDVKRLSDSTPDTRPDAAGAKEASSGASNQPGEAKAATYFLVVAEDVLFAVNEESGATMPLAPDLGNPYLRKVHALSPDRRTLAYCNVNNDVVTLDLSTTERKVLTKGLCRSQGLHWFPDNRSLLYEAPGRDEDQNRPTINIIDTTTGEIRPLLRAVAAASSWQDSVAVLPSGEVAFLSSRHQPLDNPGRPLAANEIHTIDPKDHRLGGLLKEYENDRFVSSGQNLYSFIFSPDLKRVIYLAAPNSLAWSGQGAVEAGAPLAFYRRDGAAVAFKWTPGNGKLLAVAPDKVTIISADASQKTIDVVPPATNAKNVRIIGACWSETKDKLAVGYSNQQIHIHNAAGKLEGIIETNLPLSRFDDWLELPAGFNPPRLPWKEIGSATAATPQELAQKFTAAIKHQHLRMFFSLMPTFEEFSAGALQAEKAKLPEKPSDKQIMDLKTLEGRLRQQHWTLVVRALGRFMIYQDVYREALGDFVSLQIDPTGKSHRILAKDSTGQATIALPLQGFHHFGDNYRLVKLDWIPDKIEIVDPATVTKEK